LRTLVISHHTNPELRFIIFERLNTGAVPLVDQEIRNATLSGRLNELLDELAKNRAFLECMRIATPDSRLRHHELVLRFFAVDSSLEDYKPPLKLILTNYMRLNRNAPQALIASLRTKFFTSLTAASTVFRENVFRRFDAQSETYERSVSRALFDLQMITLGGG
jgi:hypothetical protein